MGIQTSVKITTHIDERLLNKALKASRSRTKREVLEMGLRSLLAEIQRKTFVRDFEHLRLRFSLEDLVESRR